VARAASRHSPPAAATAQGEFDGREVRALRKARALSLVELGALTALSVSYLSQVERNLSTPSPKALGVIARALGVTVGWFFGGGGAAAPEDRGVVVRRSNRRQIIFREGFTDYLLSPTLEGSLELVLTHFEHDADTGEAYTHRGEEGGLVLSGRLEITVGARVFVLEAGDSFSFPSTEPHRYRNLHEGETVVVFAVSPPTY
jgi:transcriptional regulator with XRE-family HTH domain